MTRETIAGWLGRWGARTACAAALITAFALASACGSSAVPGGGGNGGSSSTAAMGSTVDIKNFTFAPMTLSISVGTTVTWKFDDAAQHTVSADDKSFLSPSMNNGQTYTHTFTTGGRYKYICSIHQYMTGTIVVK
jgi:plastocyanin